MKPVTKQERLRRHRYLRGAVQLAFFLLLPSLFSEAFAGIRSIAQAIGKGELVVLDSFVQRLLLLLGFTIIWGRFFCGYACSFGTLGDAVYSLSQWLQKKLRGKCFRLSGRLVDGGKYLKYAVLLGIAALCYFGQYEAVSKWDPWTLFAALISGHFRWEQCYLPALSVLILILMGMAVSERFFCKFLCPMGAVFALMPTLPFSGLQKRQEACLGKCQVCRNSCPVHLDLNQVSGECFQCSKCADLCPKEAISCQWGRWTGSEVLPVLVKTGLLFGLCYLL